MLSDRKVLLGITGSIAAYKSAFLTRLLVKSGAHVQVLMSDAATRFISPLTLSTLSRRDVLTEVITDESWNSHVELGLWADLMIVAPITAHTIGRLANGLCDDIITACYLSARCPVMIAPAMDLDMWKHPAVQRNIDKLQSDGVQLVPAEHGELASGLIGTGRMAEPEDIYSRIEEILQKKNHSLKGVKALVTAGPTFEKIDPVRFIGNRSSGKMGVAIVQSLLARGADVVLIIGPNHLDIPGHERLVMHGVESAAEMATHAKRVWMDCDLAILSAAVADYTVAHPAEQKLKKNPGEMVLKLSRTEDIASSIGAAKKPGQVIVGFALETEEGETNARSKLKAKNFDAIVLNSLRDRGAGFAHDSNQVTIFTNRGEKKAYPLKSKTEVAEDIVEVVEQILMKSRSR